MILSIVGTIGNVNVIDESLNNANLTENCVKFVNIKEVSINYLYQYMVSKEGKYCIESGIVGGVQGKLPIYNILAIPILIPDSEYLLEWNLKQNIINQSLKNTSKEIIKLKELQTVMLSGMGR